MSHHEVLEAISQGISVVLCEHTNTERAYLPTLKQKLEELLPTGHQAQVTIAATDADPLVIV